MNLSLSFQKLTINIFHLNQNERKSTMNGKNIINVVHILNQLKKKWIISIYHSTLQIFQRLPTTPFSQTASMPCHSVWVK